MRFEFDPAKDRVNVAKHGVSLSAADEFFESLTIDRVDDRADYGEIRIIGYGVIGSRVHCCVYTDHGEARRIISLRKASDEETEAYFEGIRSG